MKTLKGENKMEEKILDLLADICEDDIVKEDIKTELSSPDFWTPWDLPNSWPALRKSAGLSLRPQKSPEKKWTHQKKS